jgi:hypothetical protein
VPSTVQLGTFWIPQQVFSSFFLSCKVNARVYNAKTAQPTLPTQTWRLHQCVCQQSHFFSLWLCLSGLKTQIAIQPKYNRPKKCHKLLDHWSLVYPSLGLQPRFKIVCVSIILTYHVRCLLLSPAMRSNAGMAKQARNINSCFTQVSALSSLA